MPAPTTSWQLIRITGHFRDYSGNELNGTVTFTPSVRAVDYANNIVILPTVLTATVASGILLGPDAAPGILLPATNDPDISPTGWTYRVTETMAGQPGPNSYDIQVPYDAAGATLDLADIIPSAAVTPVSTYAVDASVVHLANTETVTGAKNFTGALTKSGKNVVAADDLLLNVRDYYLTADGADWGLACQRAIDALRAAPYGGTVFFPAGDYAMATAPVLRIGVNVKGAGRDGTKITSTAGGFRWVQYLYYCNISDLTLTTTSGGHMFTSTVADSTYLHCTVRRCKLVMNDDTHSIFFQDGATTYIDNEWENVEMTRRVTATVPAIYIRSSAGALNGNTWRRSWAHSNNCPNAPFFHLESNGTTYWQFAYDNRLEDIIFEQSVGGCVRALSHRNLTIDNCREWDAAATYTASNFHIGKSPVGGGLNSAYCRLKNLGCGDQTLGGGVYHINIVPGEATNCVVESPNRAVAGQTMNLPTDTIVIGEGRVTAPLGVATRTHTGDLLTAGGETCFPRRFLTAMAAAQASGTFSFSYFTALRSETINNVAMITAGVAAATVTLIRIGIYTVAANGDLTLVASTANDTSLFIAPNLRYPKALSSAWSKTAGQLYVVGHLAVATTVPVMFGDNAQGAFAVSTARGTSPALSGSVPSQTDLLSSYTAASVVVSRSNGYVEMLP